VQKVHIKPGFSRDSEEMSRTVSINPTIIPIYGNPFLSCTQKTLLWPNQNKFSGVLSAFCKLLILNIFLICRGNGQCVETRIQACIGGCQGGVMHKVIHRFCG
jgi:hypothetical protein